MTAYRLIVTCPDRPGIVARVAGFITDHGGWITEASQYTDPVSRTFFMRYVIDAADMSLARARFEDDFDAIADEFEMTWRLHDVETRPRVVILVSKLAHCLSDLLHRWETDELAMEIPAVISNHEDLRQPVEWRGVPFHCIPTPRDPDEKADAFRRTAELIDAANPDLIVLARYMQILPPWLCERYPDRIINIHHSFLPSFAGARPYHQAYERGVKLTGATCHYVTDELDAGPIIEQEVVRVTHHDEVPEMVRLGRDIERTVLARGVRMHLEDRVLVHGSKTIVFR